MPMIWSCDTLFMLSFGHSFEPVAVMPSLCSAVLTGRIQLFETTKRDGAGSLENVVTVQIGPQGSDTKHRPVTDPGQGR